MNRNPSIDLPLATALCLATVASCVLMTYRLIELAWERLHKETP